MFVKITFQSGRVKVLLIVAPKSFEDACKVIFQNYKQPIISIREINEFEYNQLADKHEQIATE